MCSICARHAHTRHRDPPKRTTGDQRSVAGSSNAAQAASQILLQGTPAASDSTTVRLSRSASAWVCAQAAAYPCPKCR